MKRRTAVHWLVLVTGILFVVHPLVASATQAPAPGQPVALQEPVAGNEIPVRLRYLEGTVTVQRAAAGETEAAAMNLPLGTGDRIWSADDGRVELMFEDGTSVWMDASTTLDFVSLRPRTSREGAILRLWTGSVFVDRPGPVSGGLQPLRFDAPSGAVHLDEPGLFRIDLDDEQGVWLSAYDGSAVLEAGGLSERVGAGQRTLAQLGSAPARAIAFNTTEADDFTGWRDQRVALYASSRQYVNEREYVPRTIVHYAADLEPYGDWSYHPTYASWYWKPHAAVSWSPYRDGRWVYTYGGWAWVPAAPWGYVTTHYGRWHYTNHGGWVWFPGRVWTPASVHWYVGSGYVGWVPLNYYGRPAVSFGVHFGGGGYGLSVGINVGGYYPRRPYYGHYGYWGHHGFGGHYGYGGCYYCYGYNRPIQHYAGRQGGNAVHVGPIGSASGSGRIVNGRGYTSGLEQAWTVVSQGDFNAANVGRSAVRRSALPRGLDQSSKTLLSGTLRARRPDTLIPTERPTSTAGRRAVPAGSVPQATPRNGATRGDGGNNVLTPAGPQRAATPRIDNADLGTGNAGPTVRGNAGPSTTGNNPAARRATPRGATPDTGVGNGASGATPRAMVAPDRRVPASPQANRTPSPTVNRPATPRRPTAGAPGPSPTVPGATPRAMTPPTSGRRTPPSATGRYPTTTRSNPGTVTRYPTRRVTPPPSSTRYPTTRSAPRGGTTRNPTVRSPVPSSGRPPTGVGAPRATPRQPGVRTPSRPSGRSTPAVRPSGPTGGGARPQVARPSGAGSRPAVRPPAGRSGSSVRPSAPPRSSRPAPRTARPARGRGGSDGKSP